MAVVSRPCFDLARFGIIVIVAAEINLATPRDRAVSFGHETSFPGPKPAGSAVDEPLGPPIMSTSAFLKREIGPKQAWSSPFSARKSHKRLPWPRGDFAFTMAGRFLGPDGSRSTSGDPGW